MVACTSSTLKCLFFYLLPHILSICRPLFSCLCHSPVLARKLLKILRTAQMEHEGRERRRRGLMFCTVLYINILSSSDQIRAIRLQTCGPWAFWSTSPTARLWPVWVRIMYNDRIGGGPVSCFDLGRPGCETFSSGANDPLILPRLRIHGADKGIVNAYIKSGPRTTDFRLFLFMISTSLCA